MSQFPGVRTRPEFHSGESRARPFQIVVMVASTGGMDAVGEVLAALPVKLPVPLVIVQHRGNRIPNYQAVVLGRRTELTVKLAETGETLRPGVVYLAPPGIHINIDDQHIVLLYGGNKINFVRPSADPLFTSVAEVFGDAVVAVVLTGLGIDGTAGIKSVSANLGYVIAQDWETSAEHAMPQSAIDSGCVDIVLPLSEIGPKLCRLLGCASNRA